MLKASLAWLAIALNLAWRTQPGGRPVRRSLSFTLQKDKSHSCRETNLFIPTDQTLKTNYSMIPPALDGRTLHHAAVYRVIYPS